MVSEKDHWSEMVRRWWARRWWWWVRKTTLVRPEAEHLPLSNPSSQQGGEEISQQNLTEKLQFNVFKIANKENSWPPPFSWQCQQRAPKGVYESFICLLRKKYSMTSVVKNIFREMFTRERSMTAAPPARAMQFKPKVAPPPKELRQLHRNLFSHRPLAFDSTVQSLMNAKRRIFFLYVLCWEFATI